MNNISKFVVSAVVAGFISGQAVIATETETKKEGASAEKHSDKHHCGAATGGHCGNAAKGKKAKGATKGEAHPEHKEETTEHKK